MKRLLLCLPLCLAGCVSANFKDLANTLKDDPATVSVQLNTVYGTFKFVRTNPGTNTATVSPDGTVTANK
jgi:hypothetical protein